MSPETNQRGAGPDKRLLLIIESLKQGISLDQYSHGLSYEALVVSALQSFTNKYPAKILIGLSNITFSSHWEISKMLNLYNQSYFRITMANLEQIGMIEELRQNHEHYQTIKNFWELEYPTSPRTPKLFILRHLFAECVSAYSGPITKQFYSKQELSAVLSRKERWERFLGIVQNQKAALQSKGRIGSCVECSKSVFSSDVPGRDYYDYAVGLVCRSCQARAGKQQIRKWMSKKG